MDKVAICLAITDILDALADILDAFANVADTHPLLVLSLILTAAVIAVTTVFVLMETSGRYFRRVKSPPLMGMDEYLHKNGVNITNFRCATDATDWLRTCLKQQIDETSSCGVGLDAEWVSNTRCSTRAVAVLQLSFGRQTAVIQLPSEETTLPDVLIELLASRDVIKYGVGIKQDVRRLMRQYPGLMIYNTQDLSERYRAHSDDRNTVGLATLCRILLRVDLPKDRQIITSNWEADELSTPQVRYAAADAFFSYEVGRILSNHNINNHRDMEQAAQQKDDGYRQHNKQVLKPVNKQGVGNVVRKTPTFANCRLLDADGKLLAFVSQQKIRWYLKRNLGTMVSSEDSTELPTLQLNFVPVVPEDRKNDMEQINNACCVCGTHESFGVKHSIVPKAFHRWMPIRFKTFTQIDIVPLCTGCGRRCERNSNAYIEEISQKTGIPLISPEMKVYQTVLRAVRALHPSHSITQDRKDAAWVMITDYYQKRFGKPPPLNPERILDECTARPELETPTCFFRQVVAFHHERQTLGEFVIAWRQHFMGCMQPRYMMKSWRVDCLDWRQPSSQQLERMQARTKDSSIR